MHLKKLFLPLLLVPISSSCMHTHNAQSRPTLTLFETNPDYQEIPSSIADIRIFEKTLGIANNKRVVGRVNIDAYNLFPLNTYTGYYENGSTVFIPIGRQPTFHPFHQSRPSATQHNQTVEPPIISHQPEFPLQTEPEQPRNTTPDQTNSHTRTNRNKRPYYYALSVLGAGAFVCLAIKLCSSEKTNTSTQPQ